LKQPVGTGLEHHATLFRAPQRRPPVAPDRPRTSTICYGVCLAVLARPSGKPCTTAVLKRGPGRRQTTSVA
jgi:hypothetical protein